MTVSETLTAELVNDRYVPCKHVVSGQIVQDALEYGNFGDDNVDISQSDSTGSFDLRGIKCERCGYRVDIAYEQTEFDKKYITIVDDVDDYLREDNT
tara:strand:+ start:413 stop:703 length:291 start_codon:yes stop_codon:yes gene_type:complete